MKEKIFTTIAVPVAAGMAVLLAGFSATPALPAKLTDAKQLQLGRGQYLVTIGACHDCHTPMVMGPNGPELDMSRALSGHPSSLVMPPPQALQEPWGAQVANTNTAWSGPWGISYTANLTPDRDTGLGKWTFRNFRDTIRTGRRMGRGRELLPPMPYPMYKHMTDEDLEAVFVYLQSIPEVSNDVPNPVLPGDEMPLAE